MRGRTNAGGGARQSIPKEYQRVAYIQSTGTQYIETDIAPTSTSWGFDIDFITHNSISSSSSYGCILGKRESSGSSEFQLSTYAQTGTGLLRMGSSNYAPKLTVNRPIHAALRNRVYTAPDNSTQTVTSANLTSRTLTIFALKNAASVTQYGKVTLFGLKLFNGNDELIADYIPCYRKADGDAGLYDLVSKSFKTNSGTGTFIIGPEVTT